MYFILIKLLDVLMHQKKGKQYTRTNRKQLVFKLYNNTLQTNK